MNLIGLIDLGNFVVFCCFPGHLGVSGNEMTDSLFKKWSAALLREPSMLKIALCNKFADIRKIFIIEINSWWRSGI